MVRADPGDQGRGVEREASTLCIRGGCNRADLDGRAKCEQHRVYDATDPQDRVLLGIQGAFNEFELAMITDRLQQSRWQKAERGELYEYHGPAAPGGGLEIVKGGHT